MKMLLISVMSEKSRGGIAVWTDRFISRIGEHAVSCDLVNTEAVGKRAVQGTAKRSLKDEAVRTFRIFKDLKARLKESDVTYDVSHLNTSCGTFGLFRDYLIAKRIKKKGIRLITHFHCDIPFWINNSISRRFLGKLVAISDERLVLCDNSSEYLMKTFGASSVKMPNFIDDTLVLDREKKINEKLSKIFFVGRVSVEKGAREIYELATRFPNVLFELAGDVSEAVATWDKPSNITLLGGMSHEKVISCMDGADIFIFPSHSEGFSMALTEAMARGLPSIVTDVGANREMVEDGCGKVVSVGDVDNMAACISELEDSKLRKEMSSRAVGKVKTDYITASVLKKIKETYNK